MHIFHLSTCCTFLVLHDSISVGYFMFVDSKAGTEGDIARLITPKLKLSQQRCLRFQLLKNITHQYEMANLQIFSQVC